MTGVGDIGAEGIVEAKLGPRPGFRIPGLRPRPLDEMDLSMRLWGVACIDAPVGFGNEALAIDWCEQRVPDRWAWLTLDEDDEPERLLRHLVAALRTIDPALGRDVVAALGGASDRAALGRAGAALGRNLAQGDPVGLVLDGYDRLPDTSAAFVRDVLQHGGDALHLIVLTMDAAALAGWPAGVRSHAIGVDALRLDAGMVGRVLETVGADATPDEIDDLTRASGGWPAGVVFTARTAVRTGGRPRFDPADPQIDAYIHRSVCEWLDDDDLAVLREVAVAGVVRPKTIASVTGREDAPLRLRRLADRHVVDVHDDDHRVPGVVRAHLLAEWERIDPDAVAAMRGRAAQHVANVGRLDALAMLVDEAPADPQVRAALLSSHVRYSAAGNGPAIAAMADRCLLVDPSSVELYLVKAWAAAFQGDAKTCRGAMEVARALPVADDLAPFVQAEVGIVAATLHRWEGRLDDSLDATVDAVEASPDGPVPLGYRGVVSGGRLSLWLGNAQFLAGMLDEARTTLVDASALDVWDPISRAAIHGPLALIGWMADDGTGPIHAAIGFSNLRGWNGEAGLLALTATALTRTGDEADDAARQLEVLTDHVPTAVARTLHDVVAAVRATEAEAARRHLRAARRLVEQCPQPGVLPQVLARAAAASAAGAHSDPDVGAPLTDGELRVVRALRGSLTEREIAEQLHLSHNTVRTYRRRAYRKLGVVSREDAVAALRRLEQL